MRSTRALGRGWQRFMTGLRSAGDALMDAVYPRGIVCLCCAMPSHGALLCQDCREEIERLRLQEPLCPLCGHPTENGRCGFCHGQVPGRMRAVWRHTGAARTLVHRLKHGAMADSAAVMAEAMADEALSLSLPEDTVVTWVAMPAARRRVRGIDHGRVLAQAVAARLGLPCQGLLARREEGRTQQGLDRQARLTNLKDGFACVGRLNAPVLLVDDVMTTSATARACAECLLKAGAPSVTVLTATQAGSRFTDD